MFLDSSSNNGGIDAKNTLYTVVTISWQIKVKDDLALKQKIVTAGVKTEKTEAQRKIT